MMNIWASLRIIFWLLLLIGTESSDLISNKECNPLHFILLVSFVSMLVWPIAICLIEGIFFSIINRPEKWKRPGLKINPFKNIKPLQFWWTIFIGLIFAGVGNLATDLMEGIKINEWDYAYLAGGIGGLAGIKISLFIFHSIFEPPLQPNILSTDSGDTLLSSDR
ncbi:MAG: hypothetical protein GY699_03025 [Desulfobacteraceae bacterium]|nr:hypothetical protein [Desulfobacteraceae bacterium]